VKTKAAVCREFSKPLIIEDLEIAEPGPGEIRVRLAACAICHSDILYMEGAWGGPLPAVFGHEAAGIVESVGPGVAGPRPGDHVVVALIRSCGHCHYCAQGDQVLCETSFPLDGRSPLATRDGESIAQGLRTGAFAEHVVVDASQVVVIPRDVPLASAALLACGVITGLGAVTNTAKVPPGASVVVIGAGGVGLNSVQGAALSGARLIIAVDIVDDKLAAARRFGATHTVNGRVEDATAAVMALTQGRGADYVFVTVGVKSAFEQAFGYITKAGSVVIVGMPATGVMTEFDPGTLAAWNQRVLGSKMGSARLAIDVPMLVDLYRQGRLKLDELISERYALADINAAIASAKAGHVLRNVIMF